MLFIASNGLTEAGASKTIAARGMTAHHHDLGEGDAKLFLHLHGPGDHRADHVSQDGRRVFAALPLHRVTGIRKRCF
jgi:hypothetical protein